MVRKWSKCREHMSEVKHLGDYFNQKGNNDKLIEDRINYIWWKSIWNSWFLWGSWIWSFRNKNTVSSSFMNQLHLMQSGERRYGINQLIWTVRYGHVFLKVKMHHRHYKVKSKQCLVCWGGDRKMCKIKNYRVLESSVDGDQDEISKRQGRQCKSKKLSRWIWKDIRSVVIPNVALEFSTLQT